VLHLRFNPGQVVTRGRPGGLFRPSALLGTAAIVLATAVGAAQPAVATAGSSIMPAAQQLQAGQKPSQASSAAGPAADGIGYYDPANGSFHLRNSLSSGPSNYAFVLGPPHMIPLVGDWNGKGADGIGYYDPANGSFHLRNSLSSGPSNYAFVRGAPGDIPLVGDWNGKGADGIGYYNPANYSFHLRNSLSSGPSNYAFVRGAPGDIPLVGDWTAGGGSVGNAIVNAAASMNGKPYCWDGGTTAGPTHGDGNGGNEATDCGAQNIKGFDCGGLAIYAVYQATHIVITRDTIQNFGTHVTSVSRLQPGDVILFGTSWTNYPHVGIYAGNGNIWNADTVPGQGVQEVPLSYITADPSLKFVGAIRF
jgi:NlpC/P60 family